MAPAGLTGGSARTLVITDIHANLEALDAVLAAAGTRGYDRLVVLGDLVGYGPDPNAVVERVRALDAAAVIRGNHDRVACGAEGADGFNTVAREAAIWTRETLTEGNRDWLRGLPRGPLDISPDMSISHGAAFDEDAYVFDDADAVRVFRSTWQAVGLFGHTHYPVTFELKHNCVEVVGLSGAAATSLSLDPAARYLVNPGAVGQPRDGDPRAAFAIVDEAAAQLEMYRVRYAVEATCAKISRAGLPDALAQRLSVGR